ncbi:hypothetical protein GQ53DRAFT_660700 [Thozetella sp. PMI_491]|nr:hypothetical protein GQ53DRAFT_660700 [Thozetella sp. PMI_491]
MSQTAEPATLADLPALVDIFYSGFNDDFFADIFPPTPEGREYIRQAYEGFIKSEPGQQQSKVFVIRGSDVGIPISSIIFWIVRPEDGGAWSWRKRWPTTRVGMDDAKLEEFFEGMANQHHEVMKEQEHIYLEIIATMDGHRKKGHGTTLLQLGSKLADDMNYILYLDSERDAKSLYESVGYVVQGDVEQTSPLVAMVRKKKGDRESS